MSRKKSVTQELAPCIFPNSPQVRKCGVPAEFRCGYGILTHVSMPRQLSKLVILLYRKAICRYCIMSFIDNSCRFFCRALLCISAAYAAVRYPSVRPPVCLSVTFVYSVETNEHIFKNFSPSGSQTIPVFPYQTLWQCSDGDKNPLFRAISGFGIHHCWTAACCQHFDGEV